MFPSPLSSSSSPLSLSFSTNNNLSIDNSNDMTQKEESSSLSFIDFLNNHSNNNVLAKQQKQKLILVMGNEAGDLDSIVSSICYSYYLYLVGNNLNLTLTTSKEDNKANVIIPLISFHRNDMILRRDVQLVLDKYCNISTKENNLHYISDEMVQNILSSSSSSSNNIQIVLMDHNQIQTSIKHMSNNVISIIDHHDDSICNDHTHVKSDNIDILGFPLRDVAYKDSKALVGSTCTLVVERFQKYYKEINNKKSTLLLLDPVIGFMLLCTILVDTMNMDTQADKGTYRDNNAIHYLLNNVDWSMFMDILPSDCINKNDSSIIIQREALYNNIRNAKIDRAYWLQLSTNDCLRLDYKQFTSSSSSSFGLSSILLPISNFQQKINYLNDMITFMNNKKISYLGVLSFTLFDNENNNNKPKRELLIIGKKCIVYDIKRYLLSHDVQLLQLQLVKEESLYVDDDDDDEYCCIVFNQLNIKASRKQVAPILLDYYNKNI